MQTVLKKIVGGNVVGQWILNSSIVINDDINSFSTSQLSVPLNIELKAFDRVELYEIKNGIDIKIFDGFVYENRRVITYQEDVKQLFLRERKAIFLSKRHATSPQSGSKSVKQWVEDIVQDYNDNYGDTWTVEAPTDILVGLDVKVRDTFFDLFDEIADVTGLYWTASGSNITFSTILGKDRSLNNEAYIEVMYNGLTTNDRVKELVVNSEAKSANIALGYKGGLGTVVRSDVGFQQESISVVEGFRAFNTTDLENKTDILLLEKNKEFISFNVVLDEGIELVNSTNTEVATIGDKIAFIIENVSGIDDQKVGLIINRKVTRYEGGQKKSVINLSDNKLKPQSIQEILKKVQKDVSTLQL